MTRRPSARSGWFPVLCIALAACLGLAMAASAEDLAALGTGTAPPGETAQVPVFIVDAAGTILGVDRDFDAKIQGLSVGVRASDPALAQVTGFTAAGALEALTPLVEKTVAAGTTTSWIAAYDRAQNPIDFDLDTPTLIGYWTVDVSPSATPGTSIDLLLSPVFTVLSNPLGTVVLNGLNGGLLLDHGTIRVEQTPFFTDGFESGDVSAWSLSVP